MIPEIGHFALIIAFVVAALQGITPILGSLFQRSHWFAFAKSLAACQFFFLLLSFICLGIAFVSNDFSVAYVYHNSHTLLPDIYKFSAVWGSHEGSMLLWVLILSSWTLGICFFQKQIPISISAVTIGALGIVSVCFIAFTLFTSNPFLRFLPIDIADGVGLNPFLQDIAFVIHPPFLFMGYIGFAVPFAFAVSGLVNGKLDKEWAGWIKPWANLAWLLLTLGIVLGSWWAYYELGWGGWWFWDAVENASLMPWLFGIALIHSLNVTAKRDTLKNWSVLLAIITFSLSLLGTFLVRSGILNSVHSFASDPERGVFILYIMFFVIGSALILYGFRIGKLQSNVYFSYLSREVFLLINNLLLVVAGLLILFGTLYPLIAQALKLNEVSIEAQYFNNFFVPLSLLLGLFLAIAPFSRWRDTKWVSFRNNGLPFLIFSVTLSAVFLYFYADTMNIMVFISTTIVFFIFTLGAWDLISKLRVNVVKKHNFFNNITLGYVGMLMAHTGLAVCMFGIAISSQYSIQKEAQLKPSESISVGNYLFQFEDLKRIKGPNYIADQGQFSVFKNNQHVAELYPEKRLYPVHNQIMTEAGIDAKLTRDLYIVLGESFDGSWSFRAHYKPFVRCIWLGGLIMALGGLIAIFDRRNRKKHRS